MRKLTRLLFLTLLPVFAGAQTVTVNGSHVGGSVPVTGVITWQPALADGTPASARIGLAGGITSRQSVSAPVTAGTFSLVLPDTNLTSPQNLCYNVTVRDRTGAQVLGPGFSCIQPAANNAWCSNGVCNFDAYGPGLATLTTQTTGPAGPPGPGCNTGSGSCNMTVPIVLPADPTQPLNAATKQYVDRLGAAGASLPGIPYAVYHFDETSGAVLDYSGLGNSASYSGAATRNAQGITFSAAGQQIVTPLTQTYQTALLCYTHNSGPLYVTNPTTDESTIFESNPTFIGTTNQTNSTWLAGMDGAQQANHVNLTMGTAFPSVVNPAGGFTTAQANHSNGGVHCLVHVRDSSADRFYLDGVQQAPAYAGGSSTYTMQGYTVLGGTAAGTTLSTANWFWGSYHFAAFWTSALTSTQVAQAERAAEQNLVSRGLPAPGKPAVMLTDGVSRLLLNGNSITACAGVNPATCWNNNLTLTNSQLQANIVRSALGGTSQSFITSSSPYRDESLVASNAGHNVALLWDGINDGCRVGNTPEQQWALQVQYAIRKRALGFKVVIGTMIDDGGAASGPSGLCGGGLTPTQYKNNYNSIVRALWSQYFDNLADFAANANLGADGAAQSATYFLSDHVHPIGPAEALIASIASAAINAVSSNTVTAAAAGSGSSYLQCVTSTSCAINTSTANNYGPFTGLNGSNLQVQGGSTAATAPARVEIYSPYSGGAQAQAELHMGSAGAPSGYKYWAWIAKPDGTYSLNRFSDDGVTVTPLITCSAGGCTGAGASATAANAASPNFGVNTTTPNTWGSVSGAGGSNLQVQGGNTSATGQARVIISSTYTGGANGQSELHLYTAGSPVNLKAWAFVHSLDGVMHLRRFADNYATSVDAFACDLNGCNFTAGGASAIVLNDTTNGHIYRITITNGAVTPVQIQ